jgi:PleD family two-component response regulator
VAVAKPGDTLETLLERADAAMYTAKRAGRNRISLATDTTASATTAFQS